MPIVSRWYQSEAIDSVLFAWEEHQRVILNSPTGSGKNFMASRIAQAVLPKRVLICTDQNELVAQSVESVSRFTDFIPAIEKASQKASLSAKIVVSSVQTLAKKARMERFPSDFFSYILHDECHRNVKQKDAISQYFSKAKVCGMTATAFRGDLSDLSKWYEETAFSFPMLDPTGQKRDLIREGFAPPIKVLTLPVEIDLSAIKQSKSFGEADYDAEGVATTIEPYYERVAELLKEHCGNRHIIAFLPLIKSSEAFAAIARRAGISAVHVSGQDEDREENIHSFAAGRVQMICNSDLLSTGVDMPIADCLVNLSPCRSMVKLHQRAGRVLRVLPGVIDDIPGEHQAQERRERIAASKKPDAVFVDFLWQFQKFGVVGAANLIARNEEEARGMAEAIKKQRTPEQLEEIARRFQEEKEAKLVRQLERHAHKKGNLAPAEFGYLIGSKIVQNYEPQAGWQMQPPTEKQVACLARNGIARELITSKGLAHVMLDAFSHRWGKKLASVGKMQVLTSAGIPFDARTLTDAEALRLISERGIKMGKRS